jgi:FkbM family methyltransferase
MLPKTDTQLTEMAQKNAEQFWVDAGNYYLNRGFPLCSTSRVIDIGGYKGDWAAYIHSVHNCFVDIYEPLKDFCVGMRERFAGNPKIRVLEYAVEDRTDWKGLAFMEDSSSLHYPLRDDAIVVPVIDVNAIIDAPVDLMAINCEGSEYNILERLISTGKIKLIRNILVQFHAFVPGAEEKRHAIVYELRKTHQQRWCYPFVWEAWSKTWKADE